MAALQLAPQASGLAPRPRIQLLPHATGRPLRQPRRWQPAKAAGEEAAGGAGGGRRRQQREKVAIVLPGFSAAQEFQHVDQRSLDRILTVCGALGFTAPGISISGKVEDLPEGGTVTVVTPGEPPLGTQVRPARKPAGLLASQQARRLAFQTGCQRPSVPCPISCGVGAQPAECLRQRDACQGAGAGCVPAGVCQHTAPRLRHQHAADEALLGQCGAGGQGCPRVPLRQRTHAPEQPPLNACCCWLLHGMTAAPCPVHQQQVSLLPLLITRCVQDYLQLDAGVRVSHELYVAEHKRVLSEPHLDELLTKLLKIRWPGFPVQHSRPAGMQSMKGATFLCVCRVAAAIG